MRPDRRRFLAALGQAVAAVVALTGCDRLSNTVWFNDLLDRAEPVTRFAQRLLARGALAREYSAADISPVFPANGTSDPDDDQYAAWAAAGFKNFRLTVGGLVERPLQLSLDQVRALPSRTQITRHDCVEGWSAIAKWTGARLDALLDRAGVKPGARYVVFYCADPMDPSGRKYYESIALDEARHPQTILAYEVNDRVLPVANGAPLRLRLERQLGYKMAKYVTKIDVVDRIDTIGDGQGGYWEDQRYEWYAGI